MILQKRYCLVINGDRGPCQQARFNNWATLMNSTISGECEFVFCSSPIMDPYILAHTATVVIPRPCLEMHSANLRKYGELKKKYQYDVVIDFDDVMWFIDGKSPMTDYNPSPLDIGRSDKVIGESLKWVDRVICSTEFIAYCFCHRFGKEWAPKTTVLHNYAFTSLGWERTVRRKKPLVVYGGSLCHSKDDMPGDFEGPWIDALSQSIDEGTIDFLAFGDERGVFPDKTQLQPYVDSSMWLATLSNIHPDIYIAPLQTNLFNKCKSELKALEASVVGAAFVASCFPGSPYNDFTPKLCSVTRDTSVDELKQIFKALCDPAIRKECVKTTRNKVAWKNLVAEMKPAKDTFIRTMFGKFVEIL